ncbi:Maf family protein [Sphingomonas flavalba]|uniref:Maf family protein n=1 Tax=Sphingomonas flavalba TaxID=2559804 RepID=UPI0039E183C6
MLAAAGVPFTARAAGVDEDAAKAGMVDLRPRDLADALAEMKAVKLSARLPATLVLGCDQVLETAEGTTLSKPASREEAAAQLRALSGKRHHLHSAAVIAEGGRASWRSVDRASLTVRPLTDGFIAAYLDAEWPAIAGCVGGYRVEGPGVQLFSRIEGSHFTILGLPLLHLLDHLRVRGVIAA